MMDLFTIKPDLFRPIFDTMASLREGAEFQIFDEHVEVCFVDKTNAAFCLMKLKTKPEFKTVFRLDLLPILTAISSPKEDILVSLDGIKVNYRWSTKPKVSKSFVMLAEGVVKTCDSAILDKSVDYLTTTITMDQTHAQEFYKLLKNIATTSSKDSAVYLYFEKTNEHTIIRDSSEDPYELEIDASLVSGETAYSKFCHEFFLGALSHHKIYDTIKLEFGSNCPCKLTMENQDVSFIILVAPRIDNDD